MNRSILSARQKLDAGNVVQIIILRQQMSNRNANSSGPLPHPGREI